MPNGAYPAGMAGYLNSAGVLTGANFLLKTSTVALATSVANSSGPAFVAAARVRPLKTAPFGVVPPGPPVGLASTTKWGPPFQAAISPGDWIAPMESVDTMKIAGLPVGPPTGKLLVGLNTCPVGFIPGTGTVSAPGRP
jgi:hypothetical protein